jgi:hypothetical protein
MYIWLLQEVYALQECGYAFTTLNIYSTRNKAISNVSSKLINNTEEACDENYKCQRVIPMKLGFVKESFVYTTNRYWLFNSIGSKTGLRKSIWFSEKETKLIESQIDLYKQFYKIEKSPNFRWLHWYNNKYYKIPVEVLDGHDWYLSLTL